MTGLAQVQNHYSPEEYLEAERNSEQKHEYFQGEIFAMAGASRNLLLNHFYFQ